MNAKQTETSGIRGSGGEPRQAVARAQEIWTSSASVEIRSEWLELEDGPRTHYLSAGSGPPLILLHGSGNSSSDWVPLMEQQIGRTYLAIDRPGFGLSDPLDYEPAQIRQTSVAFISALLDGLRLESADFIGNSGGSVVALWTAIDRPERVRSLALLGATPLLPGTTVPMPLRVMTSSLGSIVSRLLPDPSPQSVIKMMRVMGEAQSIVRYPELVDVYVAAGSDATAASASGREMTALIRGLRGFRPEMLFGDEELGSVSQPTMLIWGDNDPLGDRGVARRAAEMLPHSELHVVAGGHAPWWGDPASAANLLAGFYGNL